jgi:hypothetical protein
MGAVLGHQIKPGDREKPDQGDVCRRWKEAAPRAVLTIVIHLNIPLIALR